MDGVDLAQIWHRWWALVNVVMNTISQLIKKSGNGPLVTLKYGEFLD